MQEVLSQVQRRIRFALYFRHFHRNRYAGGMKQSLERWNTAKGSGYTDDVPFPNMLQDNSTAIVCQDVHEH